MGPEQVAAKAIKDAARALEGKTYLKLAVSFYFSLSFTGINNSVDAAFQEAAGFSIELGTEELAEGGENRFKYKLPLPPKFNNLVLKRGTVAGNSQLAVWCKNTLQSDFSSPFKLKDITLSMLNADAECLMSWDFINAYPVKWSISDFKAQDNSLSIETLEFAYTYFTSTNSPALKY